VYKLNAVVDCVCLQEELPAGGSVLQRTNAEQCISESCLYLRKSTRFVNIILRKPRLFGLISTVTKITNEFGEICAFQIHSPDVSTTTHQ